MQFRNEKEKNLEDAADAMQAHCEHMVACEECRKAHCEIGKFLTTRMIDTCEVLGNE